jgi:hypothetical protein
MLPQECEKHLTQTWLILIACSSLGVYLLCVALQTTSLSNRRISPPPSLTGDQHMLLSRTFTDALKKQLHPTPTHPPTHPPHSSLSFFLSLSFSLSFSLPLSERVLAAWEIGANEIGHS